MALLFLWYLGRQQRARAAAKAIRQRSALFASFAQIGAELRAAGGQ